jgi:hypothetical protein
MKPTTAELIASLGTIHWFASVGKPLTEQRGVAPVKSWIEAATWCEHPVTEWAIFEAKNRLYARLASDHYQRFTLWNQVASELLQPAKDMLNIVVLPAISLEVIPQAISDTILSHLTGAMMECEYSDCAPDVVYFRRLLDYYRHGRFPCGWVCKNESDFPDNMTVMLY